MSAVKIALYQAQSGIDPAANAAKLVAAVDAAKAGGAAMLFTPEMSGMLDQDRERALATARVEDEDEVLAAVREGAARAGIWVHLGSLAVKANGDKLAVVDEAATIRRHACKVCGVHLYGRIENQAHGFYGLDFIHTELSPESGWQEPRFAAFVSSIIEGGGAKPDQMDGVRQNLTDLGLTPYDALNPPLMDVLSTAVAKQKGIL